MNTRIEKDINFQCGLYFDGQYYINCYTITLSLLVETDSIEEQNVAMARVIYYITDVMQNSTLIKHSNDEKIKQYKEAKLKVCELPDDPYDQIFGMILLLKLNSILEGRMKITDMVMESSLSDGVRYSIVAEIAEDNFSGKNWWNRPNICINNDYRYFSDDNVVKLFNDTKWSDLDLQWNLKKTS